jgi:hypothetical protein
MCQHPLILEAHRTLLAPPDATHAINCACTSSTSPLITPQVGAFVVGLILQRVNRIYEVGEPHSCSPPRFSVAQSHAVGRVTVAFGLPANKPRTWFVTRYFPSRSYDVSTWP